MGQHLIGKFPVAADPVFLRRHAHMGLIDQQRPLGYKALVRPGIGLQRIPDLTEPVKADRVLNHTVGIEGNVDREAIPVSHDGPHAAPVMKRPLRQPELPVSVLQTREGMRGLVPVVEVPHQVDGVRCRRPLPVDPAFKTVVKTVVFMGVGKIR